MPGYDLVHEPWIPVLGQGGSSSTTSLLGILTNAHRYLGLAWQAPLEAVALFRQVLLPVYLDAVFIEPSCDPPSDEDQWAELWAAGSLDRWPSWAGKSPDEEPPITGYLRRYHDRFDVFGE